MHLVAEWAEGETASQRSRRQSRWLVYETACHAFRAELPGFPLFLSVPRFSHS
jgi:hypothetical protein